jgi:hypothetical protein
VTVAVVLAAALALVIPAALSPAPAWSQDRGRCAKIDTPWPIVLPDGSTHDAGSLRLCLQQMWNPVTGLHEIRVNDRSMGLFMSRVGLSESRVARGPILVFHRYGTDERHLIGYAWPRGEVMRTYSLREFGKVRDQGVQTANLPLFDSSQDAILLAALPQ